jgi:hypothetical protein
VDELLSRASALGNSVVISYRRDSAERRSNR